MFCKYISFSYEEFSFIFESNKKLVLFHSENLSPFNLLYFFFFFFTMIFEISYEKKVEKKIYVIY